MYELRSREELTRAIIGNEVVFIEYYIPNNRDSENLTAAVKSLEEDGDSRILFCRINMTEYPELVETPRGIPYVEVYYMGKRVFEHYGSLSTADLNLQVLRRGLRQVFRELNINLRI
ncbi:hypothetical protein [Desulfurococcus amylolyticus]|uniref:hypothetical protein n=1 Tax=Desulfurococcus amylolyticus TaxID=94694 RepID=UPI0023F17981|nr:hypothetical protein [Desulfurococcus amylolyticus]